MTKWITVFVVALTVSIASAQPPDDNVGHEHHKHPHNPPHPAVPDASRFHTSRPDALALPLPSETEAFTFVVFGDRTGGPVDGVAVLADAVRDTNLLEPDLVMTVGDLINGYNQTLEWLEEMREYKGIMDELLCPWFPVAGNHDVYWRGDPQDKPDGEHEANYELHFGPLWYAFEHKNSWFIVLYSDEGNPETGAKSFREPANQTMSPEQKAWLGETLEKAGAADHVFVFLHHPRWLGGGYGDDWDNVHAMLVDAGNVTAVFAGHIHRMRYDGPRDGIEYVTLATVGGHNNQRVPEAGMLHHFNVVTVRPEQVAMAAIPVGAAVDVRAITPELTTDAESLATLQVEFDRDIDLVVDRATVTATFANPVERELDVSFTPTSADSRWRFSPDHTHVRVGAGESASFKFTAARMSDALDEAFRVPELQVDIDMLTPSARYTIPSQRVAVPVSVPRDWRPTDAIDRVLVVDGGGAVEVPSAEIDLPAGSPMTLETWFNGESFDGRRGLVCKTQNSDYGIFVSNGVPSFSIFLGDAYVTVEPDEPLLVPGQWHHVAGVFDGDEVRLYLDGKLIAQRVGVGLRRTNRLPLLIGADVSGRGTIDSGFDGRIDLVQLHNHARYTDNFEPARTLSGDAILAVDLDRPLGQRLLDPVTGKLSAALIGDAELERRD